MSYRAEDSYMLRPTSALMTRACVDELAGVTYQMHPSDNYLRIMQTLLDEAVIVGHDYVVTPELGQLLAPANNYLLSVRQTPAGHEGHLSHAHEQRGLPYQNLLIQQPMALSREDPIHSDTSPLTDFRNYRMAAPVQASRCFHQEASGNMAVPQNSPVSGAGPEACMPHNAMIYGYETTLPEPLPQVTPVHGATRDGVDPGVKPEAPSTPQGTALVEVKQDEDDAKHRLKNADFINKMAYEHALTKQDPREPSSVRERKALDLVFTSGWAAQAKDVRGEQLMTNGGKAFLQFAQR